MKIALAQLNFTIGDFEQNTKKIIAAIHDAKKQHVDLVIFSELAVCGYPPRDFLNSKDFIKKAMASIEKIAAVCDGIAAIVGAPSRNEASEGKLLYNTAYFLEDKKINAKVHKTLLPTYDVFDEARYFQVNKSFELIEYMGKKIAVTICEDIWDVGERKLYEQNPMLQISKLEPDFMINISASPFHYKHLEERKEVLLKNARIYNLPIFYVNQIGAHTEIIFDGGSMVCNAKGDIIAQMDLFKETTHVFDTDNLIVENVPGKHERMSLIYDALVLGIKDYFNKLGFKKAILGLSGGLDSAVTLVLAKQALGKENVIVVLLPSAFSSDHSIADAEELAKNIDVQYDILPIKEVTELIEAKLEPLFLDKTFGLTEENIQARTRGLLLMALANKYNYILLNTTNKSEMSVGYGTLYGDLNGGLSILGDLYKTQVYELANFYNKKIEKVIPENTIIKAPSAELRPNQKDTDSLPDYDILDKILFAYVDENKDAATIIQMGCDKELVNKVLKMVNASEYKRFQTAPVLRVSNKAFGIGRRMPIVAKYS